jgi:hypothetical protein
LGELDGALDFLEFGADESRPDLHKLVDVGPKERQHHQPLAVLLAHLRCTMTVSPIDPPTRPAAKRVNISPSPRKEEKRREK